PAVDLDRAGAGQGASQMGAARPESPSQLGWARPRRGERDADADAHPTFPAREGPCVTVGGELLAEQEYGLVLIVGRSLQLLLEADPEGARSDWDAEAPAGPCRVPRSVHDDIGTDVLVPSFGAAHRHSRRSVVLGRDGLDRGSGSHQRPRPGAASREMPVHAPDAEHGRSWLLVLERRFRAGGHEPDAPKRVAHGLGDAVVGHVLDPGAAAGPDQLSDLA